MYCVVGGEANVLGERLLSQRGIGNDIVEEATYVIERPDSEQDTSSESGGSEGEGQDDNDDHDHDNNDDGGEETMVLTFDSPGGHGNIGGDEHEGTCGWLGEVKGCLRLSQA